MTRGRGTPSGNGGFATSVTTFLLPVHVPPLGFRLSRNRL